jgi:intracellular multiplication protein IcmJ
MKYHRLTLGVNRAQSIDKQTETRLENVRAEVFERDSNTCRFCGFQSDKYQRIAYKDSKPTNLDPDNLLTACIFCAQCMDLESAAAMESGVIIWLPEVGQAALNHIMRAAYISRLTKGPMMEAGDHIVDQLIDRRADAKRRLGCDDPAVLATVMKDFLDDKQYAQSAKRLAGLRLFPLDRRMIRDGETEYNQFPQILAYWRSRRGPMGGKSPQEWLTDYAELTA